MGDETRDLINNAEALLKKSGKGGKEAEGAPSTRQLVVEAERLIGRESAPSRSGVKLVFALAVLVVLAATGWFLMTQT